MLYGVGGLGDESRPGCGPGLEGERLAVCQASGVWLNKTNTCILTRINELLTQSEVHTMDGSYTSWLASARGFIQGL